MSRSAGPDRDEGGESDHEGEDSDAVSEGVGDELDMLRDAFGMHDGMGDCQFFITGLRGGRWTKKHKKVTCDCVCTRASGSVAREWAQEFNMGRQHSFSIRLYGEEGATKMALEVARRCEHFFQQYLWSDSLEHEYTPEELASYQESRQFVDWCLQVPDDDVDTWSRIFDVRGLLPRR